MTDPDDTPPTPNEPEDLGDQIVARLAAPSKPKVATLPTPEELAALLDQQRPDRSWRSGAYEEPEELRLWRWVGRYRDYLAVRAEGWAEFLERQQEGHRRRSEQDASDFAPEQRAARQAIREQGDAYVESARDAARANLDELDAQITALRGGKASATYTLGTLRKLADGFHRALLLEAHEAVKAFLAAPDDQARRFLAKASLLAARDSEPRVLNTADAMDHAREDATLDLESLLSDARAAHVWKNESHDTIARRLVATATGTKPHSRALRR